MCYLSDSKTSVMKSEKEFQSSVIVGSTPLRQGPTAYPSPRLDSLSDAFVLPSRVTSSSLRSTPGAPPSIGALYSSSSSSKYPYPPPTPKGLFTGHDLSYALTPGLGPPSSSSALFGDLATNETGSREGGGGGSMKHNPVVVGVC